VEIVAGSFVGSNGQVTAIDNEKGIATIEIEMFNRVVPVDVNFDELKIA